MTGLSLFRNRVVQVIILSMAFSQLGIWVRNLSVLLFVMKRSGGDPFAVSLISVAEFGPIFVFSLIGGAFADRWRPKRTLVLCELLSALSIIVVLLALVLGTWKAVFFATLMSAIVSQFAQPSGMKLFAKHVPAEQMQTGMSILQTVMSLFMVLGPAIGTFAYQSFGMETALGITGAAFIFSAVVLACLPPDGMEEAAKRQTGLYQEIADGFRYVVSNPVLRRLGACYLAVGLAVGLIQPLGIFLITERLGLPEEQLRWTMTAYGLGEVISSLLIVGFAGKAAPQKLLSLGMLVSAVGTAAAGWSAQLWLTVSASFLTALVQPCIFIGTNTLVMQNADETFIGRVNGLLTPLLSGSMVVTMSLAGAIKQATSLVAVYEMAALLFLAGLAVLVPLIRQSGKKAQAERSETTQG
ncbi:MFS transporter [Paenibacillus ehimensis]|uniref:MFS transporter n=1 Tax=Paenibacillus ehimensis TaxID=79264 RepID=A0ABT8VKQ2_9BACL|nr:MFS transporter [Paenibacillus ehimensis]MDO3681562.1 MFS transporter [Paenibacillus ehimensis]